ncbi:hypothetical protein MycrhDRAFT_0382 [Mycolicibacterium rhodesiae JS60]|nr:hypothetical protein MycrhDRAFT_0382 [Mycolicibacterium rhodesiae JS60]
MSTAFRSVLDWMRAGYTEEAPHTGYSPLVALTGPVVLTPRQTAHVLEQLRNHPADLADIAVAITKITDRLPTNHQIRKVVEVMTAGEPRTPAQPKRPEM